MFLHFFHDQVLFTAQQATLYRGRERLLVAALGRAVVLATLFSDDQLLIPTVDLVQSPYLNAASNVIEPLVACGLLNFVGSTVDVDVLQVRKQTHFANTGLHQVWNSGKSRNRLQQYETALRSRSWNTTADLAERWRLDVADLDSSSPEREGSRQFRLARLRLPVVPAAGDFQRALEVIPERLDGRAFLWNVFEASKIFDLGAAGGATPDFERGMAYSWILSHIEEYNTSIVGTISGLNPIDFGLARTHPDRVIDLQRYDRAFMSLGLGSVLPVITVEEAIALRADIRFRFFLEEAVLPLASTGINRITPNKQLLHEIREITRDIGSHEEGFRVLEPVLERFWDSYTVPWPLVGGRMVEEALSKVVVRLGDCADYRGSVRPRFESLLGGIVQFVRTRMDIDKTRAGHTRRYLFDPEATEADLQRDLDDYLRDRLPGATVESELRLNAGRADIVVHFGDIRFPIELKRETMDASPEGLRKYLPQIVSYMSTDSALGLLVVLDLTEHRQPLPDLRDNFWVEVVYPTREGDRPRHVVVVRVPGNRTSPSTL